MATRQALAPPVLAGYSYIRPLGSGGFADVFLFQQNMPRRQVAVKVLRKQVHDDAAARALAAEADMMAGLSSHPSILTVYEASVSSDGRPYLVMEYCPASFTNRYRSEQIPVAEVLAVGIRISSAIEAAHRAGLLHRDIKPSNILITTFGNPVLSDFGVSTALTGAEDDMIAMSPPWSAPEIVERRSTGSVASEVWALAATVYTLLAQHSPFDRPAPNRLDEQQLRARISQARYTPIARADVPPALQKVLENGLRRLPGDRYPSPKAFAEALQGVEAAMGLPLTPLEIPSDEWAKAATVTPTGDEPRGPVRSTVPVDSPRARRREESVGISGTRAAGEARAGTVGRWVVTSLVLAAVALVAAGALVVVMVGR